MVILGAIEVLPDITKRGLKVFKTPFTLAKILLVITGLGSKALWGSFAI